MPLSLSTADSALKEFYLPGARQVLNNEVFLLTQIEMNSEDVEGRRAVLSINTGRNQGVGARAENGTLPTAGNQGYSEERITLKYNYGRIEISGPTIRAMGSDRGSFVRAVDSETRGVVRDLRVDVNRQLYGTSDGVICSVSGVNTAGSIPVAAMTTTQFRQLQVGMLVDIGTVANPTAKASALTITAVTTTTVTVSATPTATAATDKIFRTGSGGAIGGVGQKELTGLQTQIAATGTLWNIDPTVVTNWASYVDANGGTNRAIAENMYTKAANEVNVRSGEDINLWIATDGVHRGTAALFQSLRRFNTPTQLNGGYVGLDMSSVSQGSAGGNTVSMVWDRDCPANTAFGLTTARIQNYRTSDWEFMQEDGAVLSRVANKDAYEATLFCYNEIATDARNAHCRISDLIES